MKESTQNFLNILAGILCLISAILYLIDSIQLFFIARSIKGESLTGLIIVLSLTFLNFAAVYYVIVSISKKSIIISSIGHKISVKLTILVICFFNLGIHIAILFLTPIYSIYWIIGVILTLIAGIVYKPYTTYYYQTHPNSIQK